MTVTYIIFYGIMFVVSVCFKLENDKLKKENEELKANGTIAQQVVEALEAKSAVSAEKAAKDRLFNIVSR